MENTMSSKITLDSDSQFFMSIAKEGQHSFVMLGVIQDDKPILLAKVGKGNLIDRSFGTSCRSQCSMFGKVIGTHTDASLQDEGISTTRQFSSKISYQAYDITYEQYLDFLAMTKAIHLDQLEHYKDREDIKDKPYSQLSFPEKGVRKLQQGISCYMPLSSNVDDEVASESEVLSDEYPQKLTLEYKNITQLQTVPRQELGQHQTIIDGAKELKFSNTCRTTARSLLNYTLGYQSKVPALYACGLDYQTTLVNNQLATNTFYTLPAPPNCFDVPSTQRKILQKLYQRLEELPKKAPQLESTRSKYDQIKKMYIDIAGKPNIGLTEMLDKVTTHRATNHELFNQKRNQGLLSKFIEALGFSLKTSTQVVYDEIETELNKALKTQRTNEIQPSELEEDITSVTYI